MKLLKQSAGDLRPNQADESRRLLIDSQKVCFPVTLRAFGLSLVVMPGVFPAHCFNGWRIFTGNFPDCFGEDVLEIGTGIGVTAIYLAKNGARTVVAVDVNPLAVINGQENAICNGVTNISFRYSDVFSAVKSDEKFDTIYWNLPFIYMSDDYLFQSMLERGLFDPGYRITERFLREACTYLNEGGRVVAGLGSFADLPRFSGLADRFGYRCTELAVEASTEGNPVDFRLHELRKGL